MDLSPLYHTFVGLWLVKKLPPEPIGGQCEVMWPVLSSHWLIRQYSNSVALVSFRPLVWGIPFWKFNVMSWGCPDEPLVHWPAINTGCHLGHWASLSKNLVLTTSPAQKKNKKTIHSLQNDLYPSSSPWMEHKKLTSSDRRCCQVRSYEDLPRHEKFQLHHKIRLGTYFAILNIACEIDF